MAIRGVGEPRQQLTISNIVGISDYTDYKYINPTIYASSIINGQINDGAGINKDLGYTKYLPQQVNPDNPIQAIFEVNINNVKSMLIVSGKNIYQYKNKEIKLIYTELKTDNICSGIHYQKEFYLGNGIDIPKVYDGDCIRDVNAAKITKIDTAGNLEGKYYYEVTFITSAGEERTAARSNTIEVNKNQIQLKLPIGWQGITKRKIYRSKVGEDDLRLVAIIEDNNSLEYIDNIADTGLGVTIPTNINNPIPKIAFWAVSSNNILLGSGDKNYPTQVFYSQVKNGIFDGIFNYLSPSDISDDHSPITGLAFSYNRLVIFSQKNIFTAQIEGTNFYLDKTQANIGCKCPSSVCQIPAYQNFPGGIMFLATDGEVRLFNGNTRLPFATSIDNLQTDTYSKLIAQTLATISPHQKVFAAIYYNFEYHLLIKPNNTPQNDYTVLRYNIKSNGWTTRTNQNINCFAVVNNQLLTGRADSSYIDIQYSGNSFDGSDINFVITSGAIPQARQDLKHFRKMYLCFDDIGKDITVTLTYEDRNNQIQQYKINLKTPISLDDNFSLDMDGLDEVPGSSIYKINLYKTARWLQFELKDNSSNPIKWRSATIYYDLIRTP